MTVQEYQIEREALQEAVGVELDWNMEIEEVFERIKDKEVKARPMDERMAQLRVKMIVRGLWEEHQDLSKLWVWDWKGKITPTPWAIEITGSF